MVRSQTEENLFSRIRVIVEKVWVITLLPQVVPISPMKPISSSIFLKVNASKEALNHFRINITTRTALEMRKQGIFLFMHFG